MKESKKSSTDRGAQSQARKDGSAPSGGLIQQQDDAYRKIQNRGNCSPRACQREREHSSGHVKGSGVRQRREKLTWHSAYVNQRFQTEKRRQETRGAMTTQRCWTNQRITPWRRPHSGVGDHWRTAVAKYPTDKRRSEVGSPTQRSRRRCQVCRCCPESEAAMKTFVMRVDTAREQRDRHFSQVKPILTNSRPRCCKLLSRGASALTANQQSRSGACCVVVLEVPRSEPRSRKLPQSTAGGARRSREATCSTPMVQITHEQ